MTHRSLLLTAAILVMVPAATNGRDITLPGGKQLLAGSSGGTGAPYETK